jgi:hypothetical protein
VLPRCRATMLGWPTACTLSATSATPPRTHQHPRRFSSNPRILHAVAAATEAEAWARFAESGGSSTRRSRRCGPTLERIRAVSGDETAALAAARGRPCNPA